MPRHNGAPQFAVAEFKLSARAETDLLEIYDYTERVFGSYQADAYLGGA